MIKINRHPIQPWILSTKELTGLTITTTVSWPQPHKKISRKVKNISKVKDETFFIFIKLLFTQ